MDWLQYALGLALFANGLFLLYLGKRVYSLRKNEEPRQVFDKTPPLSARRPVSMPGLRKGADNYPPSSDSYSTGDLWAVVHDSPKPCYPSHSPSCKGSSGYSSAYSSEVSSGGGGSSDSGGGYDCGGGSSDSGGGSCD
jgi:hypothetical protein